MATTTPNFGWSVPTSSDLVKNGATAIETLGDSIDASLVDLKGGTTGQVLAKASGTDMDFSWVTDATGIPATIFDAKGDIIAATAADSASRLAVGTNDQVLTADSSTATGLKWATPSAGGTTFSGASVTDASAISIPTATFTRLTYTTEQYDTNAYHDNSTNTSRLTIPAGKTGYYQVNAQVVYNSSGGGGIRGLHIYLNGSNTFSSPDISAPGGQYPGVALTWNAYLTAGDYVELYAYQTSGGNLNCFVDATQARFQINYLGA